MNTDRPERQTGSLIAPGANQSARQGNPEFSRAPGEIEIYEIDCGPENETLDAALRALADAEQVTGGLTFWHP